MRIAILGSIVIVLVIIAAVLSLYIFGGGFSPTQIPEAMLRATPILITSFGLSLAYLARIWNIGSEGQILLGAVASAWIGLHLGGLGILGIIVSIVFGGLCGGLWALIPGVHRVYRSANEVFNTLVMIYLALYLSQQPLAGTSKKPHLPLPRDSHPRQRSMG